MRESYEDEGPAVALARLEPISKVTSRASTTCRTASSTTVRTQRRASLARRRLKRRVTEPQVMKYIPLHLRALEEIEREGIPGLVEVLREEGIDAVRYVLWDATGWHRDFDPRPARLPTLPARRTRSCHSPNLRRDFRGHL